MRRTVLGADLFLGANLFLGTGLMFVGCFERTFTSLLVLSLLSSVYWARGASDIPFTAPLCLPGDGCQQQDPLSTEQWQGVLTAIPFPTAPPACLPAYGR